MKKIIVCLLLMVLFVTVILLSFAQQNQNSQKQDPEVHALKIQLQTVENEKIELTTKLLDAQTKLADANTELLNAEIGKYKRELKDANDEWLRTWSLWFAGIISLVVLIMGGAFWLVVRSLIANGIEKRLDGFKAAVAEVDTLKDELKAAIGQVNILQDQIRMLEKDHVSTVLENSTDVYLRYEHFHSEQIKALREEVLLQIFGDETRPLEIRYRAVGVLAAKKSPRLVSPVLEFLNLVVDSDFDWETSNDTERLPYLFLSFVGQIHTDNAYQGLKEFLNRLLTENPKHKHLFLPWAAFFLADISVEMKMEDSVPVMKKVIPNFENLQQVSQVIDRLVEYFITFNKLESIKEILTHHSTSVTSDIIDRCLQFLEKHDPDFVEKWKAKKETANTQNKESS